MSNKRLIVIGGGAAGFFCAVNAGQMEPGIEIIILEKSSKLLSKVRVSGGGRCNVTHHCFSIPEMVKKYPRGAQLLKKAFHRFFTTDTIDWFAKRGVALKAEEDGRMFPITDSSETIINCLMEEAAKSGISIRTNCEVKELTVKGQEWTIHLASGEQLTASHVCVACGGYPKYSMFGWLTQLGHTAESPLPSLFTFNVPDNPITALMGVAVENAHVKVAGTRLQQEGPLLITHWGFSGPAILKLSAWGARILAGGEEIPSPYRFTIHINWVPAFNENNLRDFIQKLRFDAATQKMVNRNIFRLPQRLWEFLLESSQVPPGIRWADLPAKQQNLLIKNLCAQEFSVKGKTTFKEEFVTSGGISLSGIDANTMMSKIHQNLFFAGEILNVDGITGGFNFQHAWTSGWIAAQSIASERITGAL